MTSVLDHAPRSTRRALGAGGLAAAVLLVAVGALGSTTPARAATAIGLGTADSFAVLAGTGITNTGPTTITGDTGTYPTASVTGGTSITQTGTAHGDDAVTQGAKADLVTAYDEAAGQTPVTALPVTDLGGLALAPGVYRQTDARLSLTGTLTLDAAGDASAVFVLQSPSDLITASSSTVALVNGVQACNVFWQVGSSATLGSSTVFRGSVLALTSITAGTAATIEGRLLARNGTVALDTNTITRPGCATGTPTTTAGPTTTTPVTTPPVTPPTSAAPTSAAPTTTAPVGGGGGTGGGSGGGPGGGPGRGDGSTTTGSGGYSQVVVVPVGSVDTGDGSTT